VSSGPGRARRPTLRQRSRGIPERWARLNVRASLLRAPALPALDVPPAAEAIEARCIVFSKDRAMQLDACLRSIEQNAPYAGDIAVVYTASTPAFEAAYAQLETSERVRLVRERDFQADVRTELDAAGEHVVFHTDDDVVFERPPRAPFVPDGFAAFSLHVGRNTTHCYAYDREQGLPQSVEADGIIAWDWRRAEYDFAYPMSVNGHVFHTDLIQRLLHRRRFRSPNELEHKLNQRRHLVPPGLLAFEQSSVVSIPANLVNVGWDNRFAGDDALSAEALNARFLAGERIDLERMDFSAVRGAAAEPAFAFAQAV
jgi:hypothetical protein